MTKFEHELAKAIGHGCPECESKDLALHQLVQEKRHLALKPNGELSYGFPYWQDLEPRHHELECGSCYNVLWSAEYGWTPELADIVKGE